MTERISVKDLEWLVDRLNQVAETQNEHYQLSGAYGGWKLVQKCNNGGTKDVTHSGFTSKKKLYYEIYAYLKGFTSGYNAAKN